mmetsp:Transcript_6891/g.12188  ORF Transcript_6891/g.12188 Transcript_6891/m.12188 type:complete len:283 (+) Transcript_6891:70-918(+)
MLTFAIAAASAVLTHGLHVHRAAETPSNYGSNSVMVVDHVPKCGGTFVNYMAENSVEPAHLRLVHEEFQLGPQDVGPGMFVIGMVRNPFDYYISMWAYQGYWSELSHKDMERIRPLGEPAGSHPEDAERFGRFLEYFSDPELGLLSFLMYFSYLDFDGVVPTSQWPWRGTVKTFLGNATTRASRREKVTQALTALSTSSSPVDCWVKTEEATADTTSCFQEFAARGGLVNFTAFDEALAAQYQNSHDHLSCSHIYNADTLRFVQTGDAELFQAFGYPLTCEA